MKPKDSLRGQNADFSNIKAGGSHSNYCALNG
jgi:hypothetical protein